MQPQNSFKNILVIRADNMGDVLMSGPAIHALKSTFNCRITLLTSRMGSLIAPYLDEVDHTLTMDLPWVKTGSSPSPREDLRQIEVLRSFQFDLAVIFTVYSQSSLPAALMVFLAGIPRRLGYCRENPYQLLTDWVPDREPYTRIFHQVERDLYLVESIGARAASDRLRISFNPDAKQRALRKIAGLGVDLHKAWILLHPGVSEPKREYPAPLWIAAGRRLQEDLDIQLLITGSEPDRRKAEEIRRCLRPGAYSVAGLLDLEEFFALMAESLMVISVNTATVHIAAALSTPVLVLYAQTNPQHTPWKVRSEVLPFSVDPAERSRNEIIRYVSEQLYNSVTPYPEPEEIVGAVRRLLGVPLPGRLLSVLPGRALFQSDQPGKKYG